MGRSKWLNFRKKLNIISFFLLSYINIYRYLLSHLFTLAMSQSKKRRHTSSFNCLSQFLHFQKVEKIYYHMCIFWILNSFDISHKTYQNFLILSTQ